MTLTRDIVRRTAKAARLALHPDYRRGLRLGVAAAIEHSKVAFGCQFATVIDVGANHGQFALFARHQFPAATVHCFEPLPAPRQRLIRLLAGDPQVTIQGVALGAEAKTATMRVSAKDDSSSLLSPTDRQVALAPRSETVAVVDVPVETLDAALRDESMISPTLLKVDVQGFELPVLRGAERVLAQVNEALIEVSFVELYEGQAMAGDVLQLMLGAGFHLAGAYPSAVDSSGIQVQADIHFVRPAVRGPSALMLN